MYSSRHLLFAELSDMEPERSIFLQDEGDNAERVYMFASVLKLFHCALAVSPRNIQSHARRAAMRFQRIHRFGGVLVKTKATKALIMPELPSHPAVSPSLLSSHQTLVS